MTISVIKTSINMGPALKINKSHKNTQIYKTCQFKGYMQVYRSYPLWNLYACSMSVLTDCSRQSYCEEREMTNAWSREIGDTEIDVISGKWGRGFGDKGT